MKDADGSGRRSGAAAVASAEGNMAITVSSHMVSGILVYGGLGWLLSLWLGHQALLIGGGVLLGVALSTFLVIYRLRQMPDPVKPGLPEPSTSGRDGATGGH